MAGTLDTSTTPITPTNNQQKIAETAFQDNLLSYVIFLTQESLKTNTQNGVTFYYGIVTNIITDQTSNYDRRDIFYSRIDGIERANNTTTKYQGTRSIYFVHIPALHSTLFGYENFTASTNTLKPEDLYKFRIEDFGQDVKSIKIGNVVKIKFENNNIHSGGIIEQVVEDKTLELKLDKDTSQQVLKNFEDYEKCLQNPVSSAKGQGRSLFASTLTTKDVVSLGLYDFIEFFVKEFSLEGEKKVAATVSPNYTIQSSDNTFKSIQTFLQDNSFFNQVNVSTDPNNKYVIASSSAITQPNVVRIKIGSENANLINYFVLFLSSSYGLQTTKIDNSTAEITFNIEKIEQTDFILYSQGRYETLKEFNIAPSVVKFNQGQIKNIETNPSLNTECDNVVSLDLYTNTAKPDWKRSNDKILLDWFFDNKPISSNSASIKNYQSVKTINSTNIINLQNFNIPKVIQQNPKFYSQSGLIENNDLIVGNGQISFDKVANNLKILRDDLNKLQKRIAKNESLNDQTVLVLPINWFEPKSRSGAKKGRDPNSQHWYGRAVDFVVYIKTETSIYQIPPEIVYLYVEKFLATDHQNIGLGLFTSTGHYLHYEILDGIVPKTPEQAKELSERYWTTEKPGGDELEKMLNGVAPKEFTSKVKEYVSKKYVVQQIGLPNKIRNLL